MENYSQLNILIVDDDETICQILQEYFLEEKFLAEYVLNGIDALKLLEEKSFDIVILNLNMPGLRGNEVLTIIKRKFPSLPVIMLSAQSAVSAVVECIKIGAVDYLTKPFDYDELLECIIRYFDRK
ncbi:MAG TPA: response regulator [Ignavibacteriaceae bacterium]|jgi:DNA-binding response OmpR family regulator|nr:MAG: hypothetical protein B6D44_10540 [Ignavibacteriales bacterium UTCHB2]HQF43182.1 response regulator [Ignavibacteriaceae bacterium]HQI42467.1 response regulator [Ignavibacteriaceae bacterium]